MFRVLFLTCSHEMEYEGVKVYRFLVTWKPLRSVDGGLPQVLRKFITDKETLLLDLKRFPSLKI